MARLVKRDPFDRFLEKCEHDPGTGCVIWKGGRTKGRGKTAWYGSFWYEGRRWYAHRWAAKFIHGLTIDDLDVDHCCPEGPNTLCVHHLQAVSKRDNSALYWIRVQVGLEDTPRCYDDPTGMLIPFYEAPKWMKPGRKG